MITFWTNAEVGMLDQTVGVILNGLSQTPEHRFRPVGDEPHRAVEGELVLAMGTRALELLQGIGVCPKGRTVTSMRGKVLPSPLGGSYLVTFDPAVLSKDASKREEIQWDVRLAERLHRTGSMAPEVGFYTYVEDFTGFIAALEYLHGETGKAVEVAYDTETMGLHPWYPDRHVVTLQFSCVEGASDVYRVPKDGKLPALVQMQLNWLLTSPKISLRGANLKYDLIWVAEKFGIDCTNFRFDTVLVGSLLDENRANGLSAHAKTYTSMGGYDCVVPSTRLLTADLRWVAAGDVQPGDELLGFDEMSPQPGYRRKCRVAVAEATKRLNKLCVRITTEQGRVIECSQDHGFIGSKQATGGLLWYRAHELEIGDRLKLAVPVVERVETYDGGWMGGFLDGEGYCAKTQANGKAESFCLGWSQEAGPIHDRALDLMGEHGCLGGGLYQREKADSGVLTAKVTQWPALKAMMLFRPERLISKRVWDGASIPTEPETDRIAEMKYLGVREVVSLQTSTRTFVAEGICSHNSSFEDRFDKGKMAEVLAKHPKEFLVYCLTGESLVQLASGAWEKIERLVLDKYQGEVRCFDGDTVVTSRVIGWYRNECGQKDWFKLVTPTTKEGRWGPLGPAFTPEHRVLTERGRVAVADLRLGEDRILTDERMFSRDQVSVLLGSLLGDGGFARKNGKGVGFRWGQAAPRAEYADWKAQVLAEFSPRPQAADDGVRYALPFSRCLAEIEALVKTWGRHVHRYRKAVVTPQLLDCLGNLGLAVWYQDDGCVEREGEAIVASRIAARLMSAAEADLVLAWLRERFGQSVSYNGDQGFFRVGKGSLAAFHAAVAPWMHQSVAYKTMLTGEVGTKAPDLTTEPYYETVTGRVPYHYGKGRVGGGVRWCITVEKHHNFVTQAGIVANCGGDTDACLRISKVMKRELLRDPELATFYTKLLHPATRAFERIERNGIHVNRDKLEAFGDELRIEIAVMEKLALDALPKRLRAKYSDNLKLSRPVILQEFFFGPLGLNLKPKMLQPKTGQPSTANAHLQMFANVPEAKAMCDLLRDLGQAKNTKTKYVENFLGVLRPNGRLHPTFYLANQSDESGDDEVGSTTGRLSAKEPPIQCMVGGTPVLTDKGFVPLVDVVRGYEAGVGFTVKTHTGRWRRVIGVYRNGVRAVYTITTRSGRRITCTGNHPVLTTEGFIRTDRLSVGDRVFVDAACVRGFDGSDVRPPDCSGAGDEEPGDYLALPLRLRHDHGSQGRKLGVRQHQDVRLFLGRGQDGPRAQQVGQEDGDLHVVVQHVDPLSQPEMPGVPELRWARDHGLRELEDVRELPGGHGDGPGRHDVGTVRCERALRAGELRLGAFGGARSQQEELALADLPGRNTLCGGVGSDYGYRRGCEAETASRVERGSGAHDARAAHEVSYQEDDIVAIEFTGFRETFDLTIEGCHSFVANGIVVHNTVPKKTKYAKRLRECYEAPKGKAMLQCLTPETRLLTADLGWVEAGNVFEGQELFGFDEEAVPSKQRKMRTAVVEKVSCRQARLIRVTMEDGTSVVTSANHQWLVFRPGEANSNMFFREAEELTEGWHLTRVMGVHKPVDRYEEGWLGGFLDGEGWVSGRHGDGWMLGVAQKEGPTLDKAKDLLNARGFKFGVHENGNGVKCLRIADTFDVFRLMQTVRPERLISKRVWEGFALPRQSRTRIVSVESAGYGEVVSIQTSTRTFVAEGFASHNCDYDQGELKIIACLSNERTMIEAYATGKDLHCVTAASMNSYEYEEFLALQESNYDLYDKLRGAAKPANFGMIYGISPEGFQNYAWSAYGLPLTLAEATQMRESFFGTYPGLVDYQTASKKLVRKQGYVRSPLGRVRHLPLIWSKDGAARSMAERQAVNFPTQSTLTDLMIWGVAILLDAYPDLEVVCTTHDSLWAYVDIDQVELWCGRIREVLENLPYGETFGWQPELKLTVSAEAGFNLAALKKVKPPLKVTA